MVRSKKMVTPDPGVPSPIRWQGLPSLELYRFILSINPL